jgi:hypothetical protein
MAIIINNNPPAIEFKRITIANEFNKILDNDLIDDNDKIIIQKLKGYILNVIVKDNNKIITKKQKNSFVKFGFEEVSRYITQNQAAELMRSGQIDFFVDTKELRVGLAQARMFHTHYLTIDIYNPKILKKLGV